MSIHLAAKPGDVAQTVLITGDPLRAKYHAESWLDNPKCYNAIRGMFGYSGTYQGHAVSLQGTGIGVPSTALYVHELVREYGVTTIIRVGTCGAIQKDIALGQVIIATAAETDSAAVTHYLPNPTALPQSDEGLQNLIGHIAERMQQPVIRGTVFSTDLFYSEDKNRYEGPIARGVLAVDMETAMIYAMSRHFGVRSLSILTVSDNIATGAMTSAEDRERKTTAMIKLALEGVTEI